MSDDNPVHMPDGIGVDTAVEGDNVDVPGNKNVDRPEFRKDFGKATIQQR